MAILVRAMDITKLGEERETGTNTILSTFDDNTDVSDWAKDPIAKCLITECRYRPEQWLYSTFGRH